MLITLLFHHYVLILFAIYAKWRSKKEPGSKWSETSFVTKRGFLVIFIPLMFDLYHGYLVLYPKNLGKHYSDYKKLDENARSEFTKCVLGFGPFGSVICTERLKRWDSYLKPTKNNLPGRLGKCDFTFKPSRNFLEEEEICISALEDLSRTNNRTKQLEVFDLMVRSSEALECGEKGILLTKYMGYLDHIKSEIKLFRHENFLKHNCTEMINFGDDLEDPVFHSYFEKSFKKLNLEFLEKSLRLRFKGHLALIKFYFLRNRGYKKEGKTPPHVAFFGPYIRLAHETKNVDKLKRALKTFMELEYPEIEKVYPYHLIDDKSWLTP